MDQPQQPTVSLQGPTGSLLLDDEYQFLLSAGRGPLYDVPQDLCVHQMIEAQTKSTPHAIALVSEQHHLSYNFINQQANRLAHYLQECGIGSELCVGLCLERSPNLLIALLAILKASGCVVPLDPTHPAQRLAFQLRDAQVYCVLTHTRLEPLLEESSCWHIYLDRLQLILGQQPSHNLPSQSQAEHLAYMIYTSGSTGRPKAVQVEQRNMRNVLVTCAQLFALSPQDVMPTLASIAFDISLLELLMPLLVGARVLMLKREQVLDVETLLKLLTTCSLLSMVPSLMSMLLEEMALPAYQQWVPQHIRTIFVGGDAVLPDLLRQIRQRFPQTQVRVLYGPTEGTIICASYLLPSHGPLDRQIIGGPLPNQLLSLRDEQQQRVQVGTPGEIYLGGAGVSRGYHNQVALSKERYVILEGERWYRTGDMGRLLPDSTIEFLGRSDGQVKIRGYRIELAEIEVVIGQHDAVKQVVVTAQEASPHDKLLVAYIVCHSAHTLSKEEIAQYLQNRLPDYMVPSLYMFLDSLPLNLNGKVDRLALPLPDKNKPKLHTARTPIEQVIETVWCDVLHILQADIYDNFFEQGGHSLQATQVISRLRITLHRELTMRDLFEAPTIAQLAHSIEQSQQEKYHTNQQIRIPLLPQKKPNMFLSFAQQRLWFLDQLQSGEALYTNPLALYMQGALNVAALEHSLQALIQRHEVLRTIFATHEQQAVQIIAPSLPFSLALIDLQSLLPDRRASQLWQQIAQEVQVPFDLSIGPLIRVTLFRQAPQEHVLLVTIHHIVFDGWSQGIFCHELTVLYNAFNRGERASLPPLPIQYADFAFWQRQSLQGQHLDTLLDYWRQHLAQLPTLELPTDRPRLFTQSFRGARQPLTLPAPLIQQIKALCQQHGATLYIGLLAAFQILLARYSGQVDIVVGSPIANRTRVETEGLLGFFVNTLVMRSDFAGDPDFHSLLARVRDMALSAYTHQDLPFEKLVEDLQPERSLNHNPLFQVVFVLQNAPYVDMKLTNLNLQLLVVNTQTAKFDITLDLEEKVSGAVTGWIEYRTDIFEKTTIARMAMHFLTLVQSIAATPECPISTLSLLSESERSMTLNKSMGPVRDYQPNICLHQLFETQRERTPHVIALVFGDGQFTYDYLNDQSNHLAHYLRQQGVGQEILVGICLERSPEMIISQLAILKAGGACVVLDPDYPRERLQFMLEDTQAAVLLTQQELAERLDLKHARRICLDRERAAIGQTDGNNLLNTVNGENLAYIIYTSGSTGLPKGTMNIHRGICNRLQWGLESVPLTDRDNVLHEASFSFDISVWELFWPLLAGAKIVLTPPRGNRDSAYLIQMMAAWGITIAHFSPSMLSTLLEEPRFFDCIHLQHIFTGGEVLPVPLKDRFLANSRATLYNQYGPTETAVHTTCWDCSQASQSPSVSIGRPIANVQVYILDVRLQLTPTGVFGEVYIGGAGLGQGYLRRPALTAEKFIPDPFSSKRGARLYKTGDIARYLSDGTLEFSGRSDNQVKIRGFRIEIGEIEAVLNEHPAIREAVVIAREDQLGDRRLVAYVVGEPPRTITGSSLRQYLQGKLPEYMLPAAFVFLEKFSLNPNGKLDRHALPMPSIERSAPEDDYIAPQTRDEQMLASIWSEILGIECIGIHDNFFLIGGHSLLATKLIARIRTVWQRDIPLRSLFEAPTIASFTNRFKMQQINQDMIDINDGKIMKEDDEQILEHLDLLGEDEIDMLLQHTSFEAEMNDE